MYRQHFPILSDTFPDLVFLDSSATSQKPKVVLDALNQYYLAQNANINRGVYKLSQIATDLHEQAREDAGRLIGATANEIVFVRGTTEGFNLLAQTLGQILVAEGDEILITVMEHHSNIVPWQLMAKERGAKVKAIPLTASGELDLSDLDSLLTPNTKIVSLTHVSNVTGAINPIKEITAAAHAKGIPVAVDGAQAVSHLPVDVGDLDCDFYLYSSHKLYGPTGMGVLYGKSEWLEKLPPYHGGGDMIETVTIEESTYRDAPFVLEAGTPDIAGAAGLSAAIKYVEEIGLDVISRHTHELAVAAREQLAEVPGIQFVGSPQQSAGVVSFNIDGIHPHDIGTILDDHDVAVRTGHHCAQPLMQFFDIAASVRASFGVYNSVDEIPRLVSGLKKAIEILG